VPWELPELGATEPRIFTASWVMPSEDAKGDAAGAAATAGFAEDADAVPLLAGLAAGAGVWVAVASEGAAEGTLEADDVAGVVVAGVTVAGVEGAGLAEGLLVSGVWAMTEFVTARMAKTNVPGLMKPVFRRRCAPFTFDPRLFIYSPR